MKTLAEVSSALRAQLQRTTHTQQSLANEAGISRQTLSSVLNGRADFKVTTLLALADRLGLELVLLPKEVARGFDDAEPRRPAIQSRVQTILQSVAQPNSDRLSGGDDERQDS